MYLGQVEVEHHALESFMLDAMKLKIKGLADTFAVTTDDVETESVYKLIHSDENIAMDLIHELEIEDDSVKPKLQEINVNVVHEVPILDVWDGKVGNEFTTSTQAEFILGQNPTQYFCKKCSYKSSKQYNVKKHTLAIHDGVRYPCDQCDYKATETGHLKKHKRNRHTETI